MIKTEEVLTTAMLKLLLHAALTDHGGCNPGNLKLLTVVYLDSATILFHDVQDMHPVGFTLSIIHNIA